MNIGAWFASICLIAIAAGPSVCEAQTYTINTAAGGANPYFRSGSGDGGNALAAGLGNPCYDVGVDGKGNVYIASGGLIRKVTPGGTISTVAGGGSNLGEGVPALQAALSPTAILVDTAGDILIADTAYGTYRVRKVDTTGTINTIAGGGRCCALGDGGPATAAYLEVPYGLALDGSGNLYIAQANPANRAIRRVSAGGTITTVAGAAGASLTRPTGVAVDTAGNIYIADQGANVVRKVSGGVVTTVAGNGTATSSGDGGPAAQAGVDRPWHVAVDSSGNLYITQFYDARVRLVTPAGAITTVAGNGIAGFSGDGGLATSAELDLPAGITVAGGAVYIADANPVTPRVRSLTAAVSQGVSITLASSPSGLSAMLDAGNPCTTPCVFTLNPGSVHTIAAASPQAGPAATQYVFSNWSDGLALSHSLTIPSTATTYTASFQTQYQLTVSASPAAGGTVTPASGAYYAAGSPVNVSAAANSGYNFTGWSGNVASASNPSTTVTMGAPETIVANFSSAASGTTIQTTPPGLQFSVDGGASLTAPQTLNLSQGPHSIAVATPQTGSGVQYTFTSWNDSNTANPRSIAVSSSSATYTAVFQTQYQLTLAASPSAGGTISPAAGSYYYIAGSSVTVTATAVAGYQFIGWSGDLSGAANPQSIAMNAAHTVTANFASAGACSIGLSAVSVSLPPTGTSTVEPCPDSSGQPNCGVSPETPTSFSVTPSGACGPWTATSSNPEFLQVISGGAPSGPSIGAGTVAFNLLNNTHSSPQSYTITVTSGSASATYTVTEAGSGDSQVYREVYALYEQLLGRDPDPAGFGFWTGSGGTGLGQMADSFLTSPEAFNSGFGVMAAYQAATGSAPAFAQYNAAVSAIRGGVLTVPGLFNSLTGSGYTASTLYQNLLNRAPAAADSACINSGLAACFQTIIGFPANTAPAASPNNEFQSTGIYHTTLAADHTNPLYVRMIYFVTVSRDPDPAGFAFWLSIANSGGPGLLFEGSAGYSTRIQILGPGTPNQGFIGSPEFQGLFAN